MNHDRPQPGKFEGNESRRLAEALYAVTLNGGQDAEVGTTEYGPGWHALILRPQVDVGYVVTEDSQGFFGYSRHTVADAQEIFHDVEFDYAHLENEEGSA